MSLRIARRDAVKACGLARPVLLSRLALVGRRLVRREVEVVARELAGLLVRLSSVAIDEAALGGWNEARRFDELAGS